MTDNLINATLSAADRKVVLDAINTIKQKLPFLIDLSPSERQALPKMGDKSRAFVTKALEIATQNPDFLPRSFNVEDMKKDVALHEALYPIWQALTQLCELVDDTQIAVGSEAYVAALLVYKYGKNNPTVSGLDEVMDNLGKRFVRRSRQVSESL